MRARRLATIGTGTAMAFGLAAPTAAAAQQDIQPQAELPPLDQVVCTEFDDSGDTNDTNALVITPVTPRDSTTLDGDTATIECRETGLSTTPVELTIKDAESGDIVDQKEVSPGGTVLFDIDTTQSRDIVGPPQYTIRAHGVIISDRDQKTAVQPVSWE